MKGSMISVLEISYKTVMKNILFVCDYMPLYSGNFIKSIYALKIELERQHCNCFYCFPKQVETRDWKHRFDNNLVFYLDFGGRYLNFISKISKIVKVHDIDIVHTHFLSPNKAKLIPYVCPKVKVFVHRHSDFSSGRLSCKDQIKQYLMYHFLVSRIRFLCVSNEFVESNPQNSVWIPNAVVCDETKKDICQIADFRKKHHIADDEILVELFGWSPKVKGVDIAVEAVKKANQDGGCYKLMIVYGINHDEPQMKKYIAEHTSCNGNESFLVYVPPIEDVYLYHYSADILLSASRSEGFPYSVIEMLSLGKRCVISSIPGTLWAKNYPCVTTFCSEDSSDCKEAIMRAAKLPSYNMEVKKMVSNQYAIGNWVKAVISAYRGEVK